MGVSLLFSFAFSFSFLSYFLNIPQNFISLFAPCKQFQNCFLRGEKRNDELKQKIPQKSKIKKSKKAKWLSEEALHIALKRRDLKGKGEKERYTHLNAEFHRITRRDKKAFLSNQSKETEENNRMGKTRDLFKKIRDSKGTFHAKMGKINDRNGMDLNEASDIKKRWQEYIDELYKKDLNDPDNYNDVITHSKSGILKCKVM